MSTKGRSTCNIPGSAQNQAFRNEQDASAQKQKALAAAEEQRKQAEEKAAARQQLDQILTQLAEKVDACFKGGRRPSEDGDVLALIRASHELQKKL